jgi:aspartate/methionine/tyrosine aminotransferase
MNNALNQLQPYPFEKLRALLGTVTPNPDKRPIALSIGEPKHRSPGFVAEALANNLDQMAVYPTTPRHSCPARSHRRLVRASFQRAKWLARSGAQRAAGQRHS